MAFILGRAEPRRVEQPGKGHSRHREHKAYQRQEISMPYLGNEERLGAAASEHAW